MYMKNRCIHCAAMLFVFSVSILSLCAASQLEARDAPANITQTDANGTFNFSHLAPGIYNLTAHRTILGAMHYMGEGRVQVPGNESNVTIIVTKSDEARYSLFQNSTVTLIPGNYSIFGLVMGPNRPGAEPAEIPYEDAQVKITAVA